jgi:hemoglobin-like flavoprotein
MNRIEVHRVRKSLDWFRPCGPALVAQTVRQLADNHPSVRSRLPSDTSAWHARWFATLEQVVDNLYSFHTLEPGLSVLGSRAARVGLTPAHMAIIRDELLLAMARLAGDDWSPSLHAGWTTVLDALIGALLHERTAHTVRVAA